MYIKTISSYALFLITLFLGVGIFAGNTHSLEVSAPPPRQAPTLQNQGDPEPLLEDDPLWEGDLLFDRATTAIKKAIIANCRLPLSAGVVDLQNAAINHMHPPARYCLRILNNHNIIILPASIANLPWMHGDTPTASYPQVKRDWFIISTLIKKRQAQSNAGPPTKE